MRPATAGSPRASEEPPSASGEKAAPSETATVAGETSVSLTLNEELSAGTSRRDDRFTAVVIRPLVPSHASSWRICQRRTTWS